MTISLKLPETALRNINFDSFPNDFRFVLGESSFDCPTFVAELLSPRISTLRKSDPTIFSFSFSEAISLECLSSLISLAEGNSIRFQSDSLQDFLRITQSLDSTSLLFEEPLFRGALRPETVIQRILAKLGMVMDCDTELEYAAGRFYRIPNECLIEASYHVLSDVLGHKRLVIESEDSLFQWILEQSPDSGFYPLLEHVKFEHLSLNGMALFKKRYNSIIPFFNEKVIGAICGRLVLPVQVSGGSAARWAHVKSVARPYDHSHRLAGIVHYLTNRHRKHVAESGEIAITASSNSPVGNSQPQNAADISTVNYFCAAPDQSSYLQYDFGDKRITLTGCAIRSRADQGTNGAHLRGWQLLGSLDGQKWDSLTVQTHDIATNGRSAITSATFSESAPYRFVRLAATSANWAGNWVMSLSYFEVFGVLECP
jgi:hypothetical protein